MFNKNKVNPEEERILGQLKDMFSATPHWRLRDVCEANNWNLDLSINQLMNAVIDSPFEYYDDKELQQRTKSNKKNTRNKVLTKDEERVGSLIKNGYRIMILMRGPPGVGKSHLARSLITNFIDLKETGYNIEDFILSSDDFFYNSKGDYRYNPAYISDAHNYNHARVQEKTNAGFSPIFVDNTNMQLWEMLPYVKCAVQNNYLIEILEPKTLWRNSTRILAEKNKHGVSQYRIKLMRDKYETASVSGLTKMLKNTRYTKTLPQMRTLPPFKHVPEKVLDEQDLNVSAMSSAVEADTESKACDLFSTNVPKEQRKKSKSYCSSPNVEEQDISPASMRDVYNLLEQKTSINAWKPYETESADFWGITQQQQQEADISQLTSTLAVEDNTNKRTCGEKSLLDLLREDNPTSDGAAKHSDSNKNNELQSLIAFERHSIGCENENSAFLTLRQIYPNKRVSGLWDLFLKCNGDVDWVVDILLKEDELAKISDIEYLIDYDDAFQCLCNSSKERPRQNQFTNMSIADSVANNSRSRENTVAIPNLGEAKPPQRQRSRFSRSNQRTVNPALLEVKGNIENCFVLGDDQYSKHLLKIRNFRSGINSDAAAPHQSSDATTESYDNAESQTENQSLKNDDDDDDDDDDDSGNDIINEDMLEMSLGKELVQQLVETFKNESSLEDKFSSTLPLNLKVFMPRSLAKQLYMLWVESAYNHMEEERQKLVREDEDFARLLKNPKYSEYKQSPNNLREILDMEYAWNIYNQDKEEHHQQWIESQRMQEPNDLASHLTQMKLCETFPDIPRETLLDMLAANGNNYSETVSVLRSTVKIDDVNGDDAATATQKNLMDRARREYELLNRQVQNQADRRQERVSNDWGDSDMMKSSLSPDDAKRLALREFEETRNLAAHHCQLKAECYQKAKEAIRSGNSGAAMYYSQIANLHKKKIDMYNHRAANCIMDVHKYTQNNPDLLDLHYLHLIEALGCLDLFLDRHITGLRLASRNYKHVFIITGRGKHSTGGVSTIKNKVKARLKERCLRWSEVNPGLLKVKIFSGTRHSKNI